MKVAFLITVILSLLSASPEASAFSSLKNFLGIGNQNQSTQTPNARKVGPNTYQSIECKIINPNCTTSGSRVIADLSAQCMCVDGDCFEIAIGNYGPKQTRNGSGILGNAPGSRYNTKPYATSTWDNDAIRMGIPQNDTGAGVENITSGGKWIHKVGQNSAGECISDPVRYNTLGCIGVPCSRWPNLKKYMGASFTLCGGARTDSELISRNGCVGGDCSNRVSQMNWCDKYRTRMAARGEPVASCSIQVKDSPFPRARPTRPSQRTRTQGVVR